jgi:hypothetical protein
MDPIERLAHIERMRHLREAIRDYERLHGELTPAEVEAQEALDQQSAVHIYLDTK